MLRDCVRGFPACLHTYVHELIHTRVDTRAHEHLGNPGEERARDQGPRALPLQLSRPHHLMCVCVRMSMYPFMSVCVRVCPPVNMSICAHFWTRRLAGGAGGMGDTSVSTYDTEWPEVPVLCCNQQLTKLSRYAISYTDASNQRPTKHWQTTKLEPCHTTTSERGGPGTALDKDKTPHQTQTLPWGGVTPEQAEIKSLS